MRKKWAVMGLAASTLLAFPLSAFAAAEVTTAEVSTGLNTFFVFLAVFVLFLAIEIRIMLKAIKKGPETEEAATVLPEDMKGGRAESTKKQQP